MPSPRSNIEPASTPKGVKAAQNSQPRRHVDPVSSSCSSNGLLSTVYVISNVARLRVRGNRVINWQTFPKSARTIAPILGIVKVFELSEHEITSALHQLPSDGVLAVLRPGLEDLQFEVERNKTAGGKIKLPVLFGPNGKVERSFEADAFHENAKIVLEVEAGRGVTNYQFLKDLFQACMMQNAEHLVVAVRNTYRDSADFSKVVSFFETLYASGRLILPLHSITIIGY